MSDDLLFALPVEVRRCRRNPRRLVVSATGEVLLRTLSDTMRDQDRAERFALAMNEWAMAETQRLKPLRYAGNLSRAENRDAARARRPTPIPTNRGDLMRAFLAALLLCLMSAFAQAQAANDVTRAVTAQHLALRTLASRIALEEGVDVTVAHALIRRESGWQVHVVGRQGEIGLTQIKLGTARHMGFRGTRAQLFDPATNLRFGMKYAARAIRRGGIRLYSTGF